MAYVWKLVALAMLSSGCVVLRGCDDSAGSGGAAAGGAASGGGGASAGGAPAGGAASGGGGAAAGGAASGGGGAGGGPTVCAGPDDCEGGPCVAGVCQGVAFATVSVGIDIPLIGVGGDQVAFLIQAGQNSNPLVCSRAQTEGVSTCPNAQNCVCVLADSPQWGPGLGTHLAVSPTGAAYYSPQAAKPSNPVFKCDASGCTLGPIVPGPPQHLNGLTFIGEELWGLKSVSSQLVRFPAPAGELMGAEIAGSLPSTAGHDLAPSSSMSGMLAASTYGDDTNPPSVFLIPELAAASMPLLVARVSVTENIVGLVLPGVLPFFRVREMTGVHKTYRVGEAPQDGKPQPPIEVYASPIIVDGGPALAADANFLYFFGQGSSNGVRLLRCPVESNTFAAQECQAISGDLPEPGPIAVSADYVFYASGETLYRAVK